MAASLADDALAARARSMAARWAAPGPDPLVKGTPPEEPTNNDPPPPRCGVGRDARRALPS